MGTVTSLAAHRRARQARSAAELAAAVGHPSARGWTPTVGVVALGHAGRVAHLARLLVPVHGHTVVVALCGTSSHLTRPPGDLPPCRRCTGT